MTNNLSNKSDAELRENLQASRQMLTTLIERITDRPDMQNAIRILMRPDDMLETFSELAVKEPDLMRLVLQASVAALAPSSSDKYASVVVSQTNLVLVAPCCEITRRLSPLVTRYTRNPLLYYLGVKEFSCMDQRSFLPNMSSTLTASAFSVI